MDGYYTYSSDKFRFKKNSVIFDLDGTLIETKTGRKFPKDENDWIFRTNSFVTLKEASKHYSIIVITNQAKWTEKWNNKIRRVMKDYDVDMMVYMIKEHNKYRKPFPTLLNEIKEKTKIKYFCGDMETDYKFAVNAGVKFIDVETLFYDIKTKLKLNYDVEFEDIVEQPIKKIDHELIILVGYPASGKTTYSKKYDEYVRINRDEQNTKSIKIFNNAIKNNKNIIIDNLNNKKKDRKKYIEKALEKKYKIRCIIINTSFEKSYHNMFYRIYKFDGKYIPLVVYKTYKKYYEEPTLDEGFYEIEKINVPEPNDKDYKLMFY